MILICFKTNSVHIVNLRINHFELIIIHLKSIQGRRTLRHRLGSVAGGSVAASLQDWHRRTACPRQCHTAQTDTATPPVHVCLFEKHASILVEQEYMDSC